MPNHTGFEHARQRALVRAVLQQSSERREFATRPELVERARVLGEVGGEPFVRRALSIIGEGTQGFGRGLLSILDLPRQAVFRGIVSPLAGRRVENFAELLPDNLRRSLTGKVLSFAGNVALDPLVWLTAGTAAGRGVAREAMTRATVVHGVRSLATRARVPISERTIQGQANQIIRDPARLAQFMRDNKAAGEVFNTWTKFRSLGAARGALPEAVFRELPVWARGGLRLRPPLHLPRWSTQGRIIRPERELIPGKHFHQLWPAAEKFLRSPKWESFALKMIPQYRLIGAGPAASLTRRAMIEGSALSKRVSADGGKTLNRLAVAFKEPMRKDAEGTWALITNSLENYVPGIGRVRSLDDISFAFTPEQLEALKGTQRFFRDTRDILSQLGHPGLADNVWAYFPRVMTPEAKKLWGPEAMRDIIPRLARTPAQRTPGHLKQRVIDTSLPLTEAQKKAVELFGKNIYTSNPFTALRTYVRAISRHVEDAHVQRFLRQHDFLLDGAHIVGTGIPVQWLARAGFTGGRFGNRPEDVLREFIYTAHRVDLGNASVSEKRRLEKLRSLLPEDQYEGLVSIAQSSAMDRARTATQRLVAQAFKRSGELSNKSASVARAEVSRAKTVAAGEAAQHQLTRLLSIKAGNARDLDSRILELRERIAFRGADGRPVKLLEKQYKAAVKKYRKLESEIRDILVRAPGRVDRVIRERLKARDAAVERALRARNRQEVLVDTTFERLKNVQSGLSPRGTAWPVPEELRLLPQRPRPGVQSRREWMQTNGYAVFDSDVPVFRGRVAPVEIVQEITENARSMREMVSTIDQLTNMWRFWVTVPFPGFHIRNFIGNWFNNYIGGVRNPDYVRGNRVFGLRMGEKQIVEPLEAHVFVSEIGMTAGAARALRERMKIHGERHTGLLADIYSEGQRRVQGDSFARRLVQSSMGKMGEAVESFHRNASFYHGLARSQGDPYAARLFVMQRLGDFDMMTPFERRFLRRVVPFYRWTRMNVPLQLQTVVQEPGAITVPLRFMETVLGDRELTQALAETGMIADIQKRMGVFAIGGGVLSPYGEFLANRVGSPGAPVMITLDIPFWDLQGIGINSQMGRREILSSLNPALQFGVSMFTNTDLFSGDTMRDFIRARGVYRPIAAALDAIPGVSGRLTVRSEAGELRISTRLARFLDTLPSARFARSVELLAGERMDGPGLERALSSLTGMRPFIITEERERFMRMDQHRELQRLEETLRSLGWSDAMREERERAAAKRGLVGGR